ncbi:MAG: S1 RNA-binding domain-containing protein [Planctomycetes bacterium]|nr:S1 RNA-binding domain-containing protein [Planctomycetota bacterium]
MTATPILEAIAREFSVPPESVQNALMLIDAGLSASFIGRFRRNEVGGIPESALRRIQRYRVELEELDRRRGTILRLLEKEPNVASGAAEAIQRCMDRFELEDLFVPHRRPEPEVQLALDRGLGHLADLLVAPIPKSERAALGMQEEREEKEEDEHAAAEGATAPGEASSESTGETSAVSAGETAPATETATPTESAPVAVMEIASSESAPSHDESDESGETAAAPTLEAPAAPVPHIAIDPRTVMNAHLARLCQPFVSPDKGVHTEAEALSGALRILSDRLGRNARLRGVVRRILAKHGVLGVRPIGDEGRVGRHRSLLKVKQPLRQLQGHRLLAIRQAQKERVVNTLITLDPNKALPKVRAALGRYTHPAHDEVLREVAVQALQHRLLPMVEQDVRLELKERADGEALRFLSQHLRQLLFTPPLPRARVAGVDVNAKGDWTIAPLDERGEPSSPEIKIEVGEKDAATLGAELRAILEPSDARCLAVGHGKGPRSAVNKLRAAIAATNAPVTVFVVNESGLSSYANSELARRELADKSVPARMAISLGRRLQDPMAEILKVDPRHLGLGSEQGLVSKANARRMFQETIESCVGHVGCDVNHAPLSVLLHMPGLDRAAAEKIVARRAEKPFTSREELRLDGVLTEAQWTSTIAFLRVHGSTEPLDKTSLHPELYPLVRNLFDSAGSSVEQGLGRMGSTRGLKRPDGVDENTWRDVLREMNFPGRDPRPRQHVPELLDPATDPVRLVKDRVIEGVITNVASFGAFVDIGLAADAMVHISEVSDRYVRDAREVLSIGQVVRARILDASAPRLSLSLKNIPREERGPRRIEGERPPRGERVDSGDRGPRRGGRGRRDFEEAPRPNPHVRAAQSRRDGMLGGKSGRGDKKRGFGGGGGGGGGGGFGGGGGGGGGFGGGGGGGPRRGRPGERGDGRGEPEERVRLDSLDMGKKPAFSPFASFFKKDKGEGEGEGELPAS